MKAKDFLEMLNGASENAEIKIENGEIVIAEPIVYKYQVGDKVRKIGAPLAVFTIAKRMSLNGEPYYSVEGCPDCLPYKETALTLYVPQPITDRIKTFEDACEWCENNVKKELVEQMEYITYCNPDFPSDILAYLKLRIITAALNEGWEPTYEPLEELWGVVYKCNNNQYGADWYRNLQPIPQKLALKSKDLATYAAKQFRDIYADFCGGKKGGEQ